jgi:hypothetical protein
MVSEASLRTTVNKWIKKQVEARSEAGFSVPDLVDDAIAHFTQDTKFMRRCAEAYLREILLAIIQGHIGKVRSLARIGSQAVAKVNFEQQLKKAEHWKEVIEFVPDKGYMLLVNMTRTDLLEVINHKAKRVRTELATVATLRTLMHGLETDAQRVGDRFSPGQIAALYQKNQVETFEQVQDEHLEQAQ